MTRRRDVAVLMATYDGAEHIDAQLASIAAQRDVAARVIASDDASNDDTVARLKAHEATLLPASRQGSAHANFYRLFRDADVTVAEAVAFADQDDVWLPGKLATQLEQLRDADAVSGNVTAIYPDQQRALIDKAQPQRELDFVCESGGPGCTFLLRPEAFALVRDVVTQDPRATAVQRHDWLAYAIVRAAGLRWHIAPEPLVDYRQHGANVVGANRGIRQARVRLDQMRAGWHREQSALIAEIAADVASGVTAARLREVAEVLRDCSATGRLRIARIVPRLRRSRRDQAALLALVLTGNW